MFKLKTKISALILVPTMVLTCIFASVTSSAFDRYDMAADIESTYEDALELYGTSSFYGQCNIATAYQLLSLGIYAGDEPDFIGDGNMWYFHYEDSEPVTSGGYNIITIGGENCLYDLIDRYGDEIYNVVVSYGTGGESGDDHVMLIRAIVNGYVYYTDSFYYGDLHSEGGACRLSLEDYLAIYEQMNGLPYGLVYFMQDSREENEKETALAVSLGDVDANGKLNAADARTILRFVARLSNMTELEKKRADIDGNGVVNSRDARICLIKSTGMGV